MGVGAEGRAQSAAVLGLGAQCAAADRGRFYRGAAFDRGACPGRLGGRRAIALGLHQLRLEASSCSAQELTAPDTEQSSHGPRVP